MGYSTGNEPLSPATLFNAYTKCNAVVTVENGAKLVIGADAGAKHGVLNVTPGSIVHIKSGGILHITSAQSSLLIKHGATLILDAGAVVRLDAAESNIRIQGDLIVNGDITFGGLGYFSFEDGNQLVFGPGYSTFNLAGSGKDKRFVLLNALVEVNQAHRLNWSDGLVESRNGLLHFSEGAGLDFNNMTLNGGGDFAIDASNSGAITLQTCIVENLLQPIVGVGGLGCNILDCEFSTIGFLGVQWSNAWMVRVKDSRFIGNMNSMALDMTDVGFLLLDYNQFSGYGSPLQGPITDADLAQAFAAVNLTNSVACLVNGCTFTANTIGIKAADPDASANVYTYGGTNFVQNSAGVFINGNATQGTLLADCVGFIHNRNGIRGVDLALMIDSWNTKDFQFDTDSPNQFIRDNAPQTDENHVRVIYGQKCVGGSREMRNNFWGIDMGGIITPDPNPATEIFLMDSPICTLLQVAPLLTPFSSMDRLCILEQRPESFETPFPGSECMLSVGNESGTASSTKVHEQFHLGTFLMKTDSVEAGIEALRPVSALWQSDLSGYPENCQQYIQVAKAFVDAIDQNIPDLPRPGNDRKQVSSSENLLIAPNPAGSHALLMLPATAHQIRVWDAQGKLCLEASASNTYRLETAAWQTGIYYLEAIGLDGSRKSGKLLVQR